VTLPIDQLVAMARGSLISYACLIRPDYRPARHHREIAAIIEDVERTGNRRIIFSAPPRHGKSMLMSTFAPTWIMGRNPHKQFITGSYAQDLANDFGRTVRDIMTSELYGEIFPELQVKESARSIAHVATEQNGNYYALGVGSGATGRGADIFLIDDPIKDREDAESDAKRRALKNWYQSVAYTRLMPGGSIIIMHTRWHEDDLVGYVLREHKHENWEVYEFPALNDEENQALWPEQFSVEDLLRIKKTIGSREWLALYQGRPRAAGGGEFRRDWFRYYDRPAIDIRDGMNVYFTVDPAGQRRENKDNDFTSIHVVGVAADGNYYLLESIRDRMNMTARGDTLIHLHRKWRPNQVRYERYGMDSDITYILSKQEQLNYRFHIQEVGGPTKKNDRIRRLIPLFESGRFYFPRTMTYIDREGQAVEMVGELENELLAFPAAIHDDMSDSLARIVEPEMPVVFPRMDEPDRPHDRYSRRQYSTPDMGSAWAA